MRRLAIIDELPYLWTAEKDLPSILLKVMEEEAPSSHLKLLVAGSHVGMMERLLAEKEALHDRLRPLRIRALDFWRAKEILGPETPDPCASPVSNHDRARALAGRHRNRRPCAVDSIDGHRSRPDAGRQLARRSVTFNVTWTTSCPS